MTNINTALKNAIESKKRDLDLEKTISSSSSHSVLYARDVINGRFLPGEQTIASDPYFVCAYIAELDLKEIPENIHNVMLSQAIKDSSLNEDKNYWLKQYFAFCDYLDGKKDKPWWALKNSAKNWNYGEDFYSN